MNNQLQKKDSMKVPEPTLRRLPWYLSNVKLLRKRGERFVSSTQISKEINIDASQIAKDLSYVNISGRTRVGYDIDTLIAVLEDFLGFTNIHKAFLFGVGSLGGALLRDSGLSHFGLEIVAAFDVNPDLVGTTLNGIPIFHSDDFEKIYMVDSFITFTGYENESDYYAFEFKDGNRIAFRTYATVGELFANAVECWQGVGDFSKLNCYDGHHQVAT